MSDSSQVRRRRLGESDLLSNGFDSSLSNGACKKRTFGYCETVVVWVLFFSLILLNFAFIQYRFHNFPHPKDAPSDQEALKNGEFYESLAREHLETVTNFGSRPTGSVANEVHARNYILDQLSLLKNNVNPRKKLEVDVQQVNGSFYLYFIHTHFYSVYENIANIAVKLGPVSGADHSVLMNCHYDTMVDSPGAGDDMSSCAVMLEIIRSLSSSDEKLRHNIIFLFNSAEENILQASHGFITQHPWAPSIKAFVNLDSAGAGGWEIVFQTGPQNPWLVKSYIESAPYPSASVINQEIFEMELVPGDTDFRIFRDFGKIPGVDVAYISNGYVYHTALDKAKYIPPGCLQRAGENLRALIKTLATSPKLPDPGEDKHGSMVFYDFVGLVLIHYPKSIGTIINYFSAVFAFIYLIKKWNNSTLKNGARSPKRKKSNGINGHDVATSWRCGSCSNHNSLLATLCANCSGQHQYQQNGYSNTQEKIPESVSNFDGPQYFQYIFRALISIIATWVVCCISVMLVAMILSQLGRGMFWFTHSNNFIFIFTIPAVFTAILFHSRLKETVFKGLDSYAIEEIYFDTCLGVCAFWTFLMTYYGLAMTFVCAMATFFPLAARMLYNALPTVYKNNPRVLIGLQICGLFVPTILMCYIIFCLFELFVPIFGRVGSAVNPDLALAGFAVVVTMIFIHYLIGITYICDMKPVLHILVGVFSISVILVLFTSLGFPYKGDEHSPTAQRFLVMNINREFYHKNGSLRKTDSGLWYQPFDFHGLHFAKMYVPELDNTPYTIYEGDAPYLGAPFLLPMAHIMDVRVGKYLHLPPFQPLPPVQGQLVKQEEFISSGFKRFTFQMSGPDHMNVHIVPESGVQLKAWSISPGTPKPATLPPDAQITSYYIYYGYGTKPTNPWEFHIDLSGDVFSSEKPAVKIAFCGCYIHGDQKDTAPLKKMKDRLPDWAVMNSFSCTYSQHTY